MSNNLSPEVKKAAYDALLEMQRRGYFKFQPRKPEVRFMSPQFEAFLYVAGSLFVLLAVYGAALLTGAA